MAGFIVQQSRGGNDPPVRLVQLLMPGYSLPAFLAQSSGPTSAPAPLPKGPLLERLLFEQPLGTAALIGVLGLVGFLAMRRLGKVRQATAIGGVAGVLALGVVIASALVTTARERVRVLTREIVQATASVDSPTLVRLLAPDACVSDPRGVLSIGFPTVAGRDELLEHIVQRMGAGGPWKLRDWSVGRVEATLDGPQIARTQVRVRVTSEAGAAMGFNFATASWWRIDWRRSAPDASDWQAFAIEPLAWERPGFPK